MEKKPKVPNAKLRYQRELRGWSQQKVAELLDTNMDRVSRWECGESTPGPHYREKLVRLFHKSAVDLGMINPPTRSEHLPQTNVSPSISSQAVVSQPLRSTYNGPTPEMSAETLPLDGRASHQAYSPYVSVHTVHRQAIDVFSDPETPFEKRLGAWLELSACGFVHLSDEGWSVESTIEALQAILPGVKAMSKYSRRQFFEVGAAAMVAGIPVPQRRHVSFEERTQLCNALSESIAAGWKLFHTAGTQQVLAVGHAQLTLVQQSHALLYPRVRSIFYSSVQNMMGRALHHQERYEEALEAHVNAHIAAMSTGNPWDIAQSLICQADSYQALGQHEEAIAVIEEALQTLGMSQEEEHIRSKAHLLACWADNAMMMGDDATAQQKLDASAVYLHQISSKEEFDRTSWLQLAGKRALLSQDYKTAITYLEEALTLLPAHWMMRSAGILIPLAMAYARAGERDISLEVARKALPIVAVVNAKLTNKYYLEYIQHDLLPFSPQDGSVRSFAKDVQHQLPLVAALFG